MINPEHIRMLERQLLYSYICRAFHELHPGTKFISNWHIDALCKALEDVYVGRTKRLLITMPPRHLKSICTSVGFCAWALGKDPTLKIIAASYGDQLARDHTHNFRKLIETEWHKNLFKGMTIDQRANRASEVKTEQGGGRLAVARGGSVTGFGADIIIVDDLLKADEGRSETARLNAHEFFTGTLLSRLNNRSTGRVIVIQQRLHEDDIAGRLIASGQYTHLNLPAIAEENQTIVLGRKQVHTREPGDVLCPTLQSREVLEQTRREMGQFQFNAQYQQNPTPPDGGIIRWDWFESYNERPQRNEFQQIIQSWDTGMSADPQSDFSVCLTFGYKDRKWWLLDVFRRQLEFPDLVRAAHTLRSEWLADRVIIEKKGSGISLLQELKRDSATRGLYRAFTPKMDKEDRMRGQTAKLSEGLVALPNEADWLAKFRHELNGFPNTRNDDQVDALSQFLWHLSRRGGAFVYPDDRGERPNPTRRQSRR